MVFYILNIEIEEEEKKGKPKIWQNSQKGSLKIKQIKFQEPTKQCTFGIRPY